VLFELLPDVGVCLLQLVDRHRQGYFIAKQLSGYIYSLTSVYSVCNLLDLFAASAVRLWRASILDDAAQCSCVLQWSVVMAVMSDTVTWRSVDSVRYL
jgi:hypothetical protein